MKIQRIVLLVCLSTWVGWLCARPAQAAEAEGEVRSKSGQGAAREARRAAEDREAQAFFDGPIRSFEIVVTPENYRSLRRDGRQPVPATVRVGTNVFESVAIHIKGAAGSSRPIDDRPALTLNFDKLKDGQTCFGMDKLHLNNSVQDASFANEALASAMYLRQGVPTARTTHALVKLNNRDLGLYVLKEGYSQMFIRRHFPKDNKGNLYDGGFVRDIHEPLKLDTGRGVTNHADLRALLKNLNLPPKERQEALNKTLDVDRFLTTMALQCLTDDWDGYARNHNNYRLYIDTTGRATFIPHGMDQLFQDVDRSIRGGWSGVAAQRVFELPEMAERFRERITILSTNEFSASRLVSEWTRIRERLRAGMEMSRPGEWRELDNNLGHFRRQLDVRAKVVANEIARWPRPPKPLAPGTVVPIAEWRKTPQQGQSTLDYAPPAGETKKVFHLVAKGAGTVVSFRSTTQLPAGHFMLKARARVKNVVAAGDQRGLGAGVRVSGGQRTMKLEGTTDWTEVSFDFIRGEPGPVDLILELRANQGEAWFDADSIQLIAQ